LVEATIFTLTTRFTYTFASLSAGNGLGARVAVEVVGQGTTTVTLDYAAGSRILAEGTITGTTLYLYGHDCLGELRDDEWLYYLNDAEGLVRQGADDQGQAVSAWLFDPDGAVLEGPESLVSHLVCGGVYDWSTGLVYKDGRYFDPLLGIWLALAPLVVVQSWCGRRKKQRGFPWCVVVLFGVCVSGTLTACRPGTMRNSIGTAGLVVLTVLATACTGGSPLPASPVVPPRPSQMAETTGPAPTVTVEVSPAVAHSWPTAVPTVPSLEIRQVTSGRVHPDNFWWADSQTLYYSLTGQTGWWSYSVQTDITRPLKVTPLQPGVPSPETLSQIPEGAVSIAVSPSRQRTLYVTRQFPLPTPEPDMDGETEWVNIPSELWLMENGRAHLVGPIEDCIEDYLWSDDEQRVVARSRALIPCQAYAWLVNLEVSQVIPLIPREEESVEVIDLSPSGQKALVRSRSNGRLYALDVTSAEAESLDLVQWAWGQWLDEDRLIVGESHALQGARWTYNTFWLYDIHRHERVQVLGADITPGLATREFAHMFLSPDRRWLAFVASQDLVNSLGEGELWVARMNASN
jgi:hypothetical protein